MLLSSEYLLVGRLLHVVLTVGQNIEEEVLLYGREDAFQIPEGVNVRMRRYIYYHRKIEKRILVS